MAAHINYMQENMFLDGNRSEENRVLKGADERVWGMKYKLSVCGFYKVGI